jgi:uncharacterized protein YbcI
MDRLKTRMAQEIAAAASQFQQQRTGHAPGSVTVMLGDNTLVITLHDALSPAEQAMAQSADGAAQVQEFHRQLFASSSDAFRQEIKRITGVAVQDAVAEIETTSGTVVHTFTTGTMVQVFQLATNVPQEIPGDLVPICPVTHDAGNTAGSTPLLERNPMNKPMTSSHPQPATATAPGHTAEHACCCVNGPTHEDIANRAYDIYLKNGRKQGQCKQNWQQAEQSLRDQSQASHRAQEHSSGAVAAHARGAK